MATIGKITVIAIAFLVILLATAAAIEVGFGEKRPVLVNIITLALTVPLALFIWRRK